MNAPHDHISDTLLLQAVLQALDEQQLEELCLYFPAKSALGGALRSRLDAWRGGFAPLKAAGSVQNLRDELLAVVGSDRNFRNYFWTELTGFLDAKEIKDSELYQAIGMSASLYNSHKNRWAADVGTHTWQSYTDRDYVLSMCFALRLNFLEMKTLLAYGGQPLNPGTNARDYLLVNCVLEGTYDPAYVNNLLEDAGLAPLPYHQTVEQIRSRPKTRGKRHGNDPE